MSYTYMTVYQDEVRTLELMVRDQYDVAFIPDTASYRIDDIDGNIVQSELPGLIRSNYVYMTITTTVSSVPGEYHVIWKVQRGASTYYHKTILNVKEI